MIIMDNTSVGIDATNHVIGGSSTNLMPPELFVFSRLDNNRFKVAGLSTSTTAFNIRNLGTGTEHSFSTIKPENKTLIQIDGMIQSPLTNRSVNLDLIDAVGVGSTTLKLQASANVGLTTVKLNDIIQIDDEFFRVKTVGFGSTNVVSVDRGFLGSTVASHAANATPQMKGGNFRIDKDVVFFATPPFGPTGPLLVLVHNQHLVVESLIEKMLLETLCLMIYLINLQDRLQQEEHLL
ncbi:MAG: hypothetical protein CM15mL3_1420 [Kanaloavirus sp.]|nr:MAG: hypothetical protein CM15mL3_1420 [Kanaloavirus sp.]